MKLPEHKRLAILIDYENEYKNYEIAARQRVNGQTVADVIKRFHKQKLKEKQGEEFREAIIDELLSEIAVFCPYCTGTLTLINSKLYRCNDCKKVTTEISKPNQRERINLILKRYAI